MAETVDPLIGQVLSGRFEIVAPLGVGGMGRVYKAVQRPLGREVALKVLNPRYDGSRDPGFERRFFLEASMTAKLKHPNTITVHDYGRTDDGIFFIAMELLEGETLQKVLADNGRLPWPRALFITGQVARSLREAHKMGIVHRDLKPANVMLMSEGTGGDTVKVLDFGLVKSFTPDHPKDDDVDQTGLTQAGVLLGSPLYMAPEQARGEADPRTDIYALGVLMFQTMCGRPPFQSRESIDVIVKHIREQPPELTSFAPDVPPEVNALVMKCLEKDPAARFQSMDELLEAMRLATVGQGLSGAFNDPRTYSGQVQRAGTNTGVPVVQNVATPSFTEESIRSLEIELEKSNVEPPPSKKLPLVLAAIAVAFIGVAVGGFIAWRSSDKPVVVPTPPAALVVPPPKPTPAPITVTFAIDSTPHGATVVSSDGTVLGTTPLVTTRTREGAALASIALTFSLEGYDEVTTSVEGREGTVSLSQPLSARPVAVQPVVKPVTGSKKPPRPGKPDKKGDGFKDDPY